MGDESITMAEVTAVVKRLPGGRVPGVDKIHSEMLEALDVVGQSWLTCLFNVTYRGLEHHFFQKGVQSVNIKYCNFELPTSLQQLQTGEILAQ